MMKSSSTKQVQKSDNSMQAGRDINYGITASDVIAIVQIATDKLRAEYVVSEQKLNSRVERLSERLVPSLTAPSSIGAFNEPDFIHNVKDAYQSAGRSMEVHAAGTLTEILKHRSLVRDPTARYRMAVRKALEVAPQISTPALNALSIAWFTTGIMIIRKDAHETFSYLDEVFSLFLDEGLPDKSKLQEWAFDMDILDCARVNTLSTSFGFKELISNMYNGYFATGMTKEEANDVRGRLESHMAGMGYSFIVEHPFVSGNYVLIFNSEEQLRSRFLEVSNIHGCDIDASKELLELIVEMNKYSQKFNGYLERLGEIFNKHKSLLRLSDWWDKDFPVVSITPVGHVIAHSNIMVKNETMLLPKIEEM